MLFAAALPAAASWAVAGELPRALRPFWKSQTMERESLFFVREEGKDAPSASLYFVPEKIESVKSADGETTFEAGKDYVWKAGSRELMLPVGSRIPSKTAAQMHPPKGAPQSIGSAVGGKSNLFWAEGHLFHDLQVEVTYSHAGAWPGAAPQFAGKQLPKSLAKLQAKQPLRLVVLGDSISQGYNASGYVKAKPGQPPYPDLVAKGLEAVYGGTVEMKNLAVAGRNTPWGISMAGKVAAEKPDLAVIAFGMNDAGLAPAKFAENVRAIMDGIRKDAPATEFILVATMVGNAEWTGARPDAYPKFRDELAKMAGDGVAVADVTSVWQELLKRKKFADLTGNGVNHPNDFGHRLYAQVILQLLVAPAP